MKPLRRIFLDTNIFIIGDADKQSLESLILEALGYRKLNMVKQIVLFLAIEN